MVTLDLKPTYHVDWCQLAEHLAEELGVDEIDISEVGNATYHVCNTEMNDYDKGEFGVEDRQEVINQINRNGVLPAYSMGDLLKHAAAQGWIPQGWYCVGISW